ncbi:MAG: sugar phosphate isomerase/epimerase [Oscillospiraceae bacterium]|nr:sugar phosphate isomerase/epimerase [Oscillospiraceae bacterium]
MKIGFSGQALGDVMPFGGICDTAKKYNMTTCEIWPNNAEGSGEGYLGRDIKKLKRVAADKGVIIECVTFASGTNDSGAYVKLFCNAVETAAELGALRINHYCGHISKDEADFDRMEKFWSEPLKLAEKHGIILALENEAHDATRTPDRMLKIIRHFNSKCFKTNLDATNYYEAHCDGFPDAYETLKDYIGYVHLKNARRHPDGFSYVPIPEGAVHIAGILLKIAEDRSYDGLCSLEPHVKPELVEAYYACESKYIYNILNFSRLRNDL